MTDDLKQDLTQEADFPGEEWRQCLSFPFYKISNYGRLKGRKIRPVSSSSDCPRYSIRTDKGPRGVKAHHLVAEAFLGPRPEGAHVRRRDKDPSNCCAENLYYDIPGKSNGAPPKELLEKLQTNSIGGLQGGLQKKEPQAHPANGGGLQKKGLQKSPAINSPSLALLKGGG